MAFIVCFWINPTFSQTLERDFSDLFDRCRMSIETSSIFDSNGLRAVNVAKRHGRDWGAKTKQKGWMSPGSELYVVLTEWTARDGATRHLCDIYLTDDERVLDISEQALFLRQFLIMQTEMIGAGSHDLDRRLSPIPPVINAAFLLSKKNPSGCSVSNTIAVDPNGTFFSAGSGEQAIKECETN